MPIAQSTIVAASNRYSQRARTAAEARRLGMRTAFLCHSHLDARLVKGMIALFKDAGWDVYVDWEDSTMPATPNRTTAVQLQQRIRDTNYFLFLATENSMNSRWCPWEIGYADGVKSLEDIAIIPTSESTGIWHGSEYLELYSKIDLYQNSLQIWRPGQQMGSSLRYRW